MRVYLGIGSNIRADSNVIKALVKLSRYLDIDGVSTFYETVPDGVPDGVPEEIANGNPESAMTNYINGVIRCTTTWSAGKLRRRLKRIERSLGRDKNAHGNNARPIDLDIVLYGDQVIQRRRIAVPDKDIPSRPYLSVPLCELDPQLILPGAGENIGDIARQADRGLMIPLSGITTEIRRTFLHE